MSSDIILYFLMGIGILFAIIVIAYFMLRKKMNTSGVREIQKLREGTEEKKFSSEILYQKLYVIYQKIPFLKRYLLKIRRRLEIINIDDEYNTRKGTAKILTKTLAILVPIMIITIMMVNVQNKLLFIYTLMVKILEKH